MDWCMIPPVVLDSVEKIISAFVQNLHFFCVQLLSCQYFEKQGMN